MHRNTCRILPTRASLPAMANILVFGTGNIGSVYASILVRGGTQVTCVCRSNYQHAKMNGIRVTSPILGDMATRPLIVQSVAEAVSLSQSPFDFILVCTKATAQTTRVALELLVPALTRSVTAIVLIQNGLGVERRFHEAFPTTTIISGVAYLPTTQESPGVFSHSEMELLHLGIYPPESDGGLPPLSSTQLETFAGLVKAGGATAVVSEDIQVQRWAKVVANGAVSPICALSRCRDRQLMHVSRLGAALFKDVMLEIAAVAASAGYGHVVTRDVVDKQFTRCLARPFPGVQPSMMADALDARPMEVQAVLGEVVGIAQRNAVPVPRLETLFVLLEGLDSALRLEQGQVLGDNV